MIDTLFFKILLLGISLLPANFDKKNLELYPEGINSSKMIMTISRRAGRDEHEGIYYTVAILSGKNKSETINIHLVDNGLYSIKLEEDNFSVDMLPYILDMDRKKIDKKGQTLYGAKKREKLSL